MTRSLKVASVLSWISLLFWGLNVISGILGSLTAFNPLILVMLVILASIPLHSYAAIQLHKSIRRPEIKLSHQTPSGIRFVGLVALMIGFLFLLGGMIMSKNAAEMLATAREQGFMKEMYDRITVDDLRRYGYLAMVLGLITVVNVILNLRLLRWYYLVHQSDASKRDESQ
ncbi:hypothetical protein [Puia sp.]|jgi:hypothetical protein|uniref:hypothetical protein n=1 Tax=Puia sp. TaxID=2045100 RepID=UPI002F41C68F